MKLGICGITTVEPGTPVTDEMKVILGRNRLRNWWEAKYIELARFDGDEGKQLPREECDHVLFEAPPALTEEELIERISGTPIEIEDEPTESPF